MGKGYWKIIEQNRGRSETDPDFDERSGEEDIYRAGYEAGCKVGYKKGYGDAMYESDTVRSGVAYRSETDGRRFRGSNLNYLDGEDFGLREGRIRQDMERSSQDGDGIRERRHRGYDGRYM